jgi:hypothetical protein
MSTYNQSYLYTLVSRSISHKSRRTLNPVWRLPKAESWLQKLLINLCPLQQRHVRNLRLNQALGNYRSDPKLQYHMLPHALQIGHVAHGKVQTIDQSEAQP